MATVDALVMGRNTFDVVAPFETWPYGEKPVVVLSHRALQATRSGAAIEAMSGEPAEIVRRLEGRGLRHISVDGGDTVQRFLRAGLISNITITRVPVVIGSGISLFGSIDRDIMLRHIATREFPSGLVQSEYEVGANR